MAISGSGTQLDPWILRGWDDFQSVMGSSGYAKFDNVHETISGSGTQLDPKIVSTYEEMLAATQADYIWQVKLVDRDNKIYRYNDIFCFYDESLSTIDFNTIYPEGTTSVINITCNVDFNGWTFRNFVLNGNSGYMLWGQSTQQNGRFINMYCTSLGSNPRIQSTQAVTFENFIWDITSNTGSGYIFHHITIKNSAIHYKCLSGNPGFGSAVTLSNVCVHYDVNATTFSGSGASGANCTFNNCLFTGQIKATGNNNSNYIAYYTSNCIFDIQGLPARNDTKLYLGSTPSALSLYNADKMTSNNYSAYMGLTTAQLKDASYLASLGFPIGVD